VVRYVNIVHLLKHLLVILLPVICPLMVVLLWFEWEASHHKKKKDGNWSRSKKRWKRTHEEKRIKQVSQMVNERVKKKKKGREGCFCSLCLIMLIWIFLTCLYDLLIEDLRRNTTIHIGHKWSFVAFHN